MLQKGRCEKLEKKELMKARGLRLKKSRIEANLTQEELANIINLSVGTIKSYEIGNRDLRNNAYILAEACGVRPEYLLCADNIATNEQLIRQKRDNDNGITKLLVYALNESALFGYSCIWTQDKQTGEIIWTIKDSHGHKYQCQDSIMQELGQDLLDYLTMRLEKRVLPNCKPFTGEIIDNSNVSNRFAAYMFDSGITDSPVLKAAKRRGLRKSKQEDDSNDPVFD